MPPAALAQQPPASTLPATTGRVRLPPKISKALRLLLTGECKTQKAAAERVGMNASYLCDQLSKPKVQAFVARETRRTIAQGAIRASVRLVELVDAESEHVSAAVAQRILTDQGILKSDQGGTTVNVAVSAGYVVDLREPNTKPMTTIDVSKAE